MSKRKIQSIAELNKLCNLPWRFIFPKSRVFQLLSLPSRKLYHSTRFMCTMSKRKIQSIAELNKLHNMPYRLVFAKSRIFQLLELPGSILYH
jgi:hypothetical protein